MSLHTHTNNYPHAFLIVQLNKVASQEEEGYTENNMLEKKGCFGVVRVGVL